MRYPLLNELNTSRDMVDAFGGYNHNLRIGNGEFYDMKNLSSDGYPVLTQRHKRGVYASVKSPGGLIAKDALCYVDGSDFVINGYPVNMGLTPGDKTLISMGAYVIIMPDKMWVKTISQSGDNGTFDHGYIEASFVSDSDVTFTPCTLDGNEINPSSGAEPPQDPANLSYWVDTSSSSYVLKQYSADSKVWLPVASPYVKVHATGIGDLFELYDGVRISGVKSPLLSDLNTTMPIWGKGDNYIIVVGVLDGPVTQSVSEGAIRISREMPELDFIVESGNRLWGCRYGFDNNNNVVNEIYASKLGDFKNWNCFMGLSTDSYTASVGTDGVFTGAITHMGYPLFFKENCVHKVYGNFPSNFQVQETALRGVQRGSHGSLAIVNEILYYKARHGVCAYDGSLPVDVSAAFGDERYSGAVGVAHGNKYYVSMSDSTGKSHLFVYDTTKGMWHKEDELKAKYFCSVDGELYCIEDGKSQITTILGSGVQTEGDVEWMAETGDLYLSSPDMKYISKLTVRMSMDVGAKVAFYVLYDRDTEWTHVATVHAHNLRSFSLPIRPLRCDHLKLRMEGKGGTRIYSITKTVEQGSDIS
jgi:hypothetical protein